MIILELFSGTESISKVAKARGHKVFTIDNNPEHNPDWCMDIKKVESKDIVERFGHPDVIWASPPCHHFSIATHKHWKNKRPKKKAKESIKLVSHTLKLIIDLFPTFWFMENPRGRLRFVLGKPYTTVYYGAYNHACIKPTDLWGHHPKINWKTEIVRKMIEFKDWSSGKKRQILRSVIPENLCLDIIKACESELAGHQVAM